VPASTLLSHVSVGIIFTLEKNFIKSPCGEGIVRFSDVFNLHIFIFYLAKPFIQSDTGVFLVCQLNNLLRENNGLLEISKYIPQCTDIFPILQNANHA
jgi:hypothetical protein